MRELERERDDESFGEEKSEREKARGVRRREGLRGRVMEEDIEKKHRN